MARRSGRSMASSLSLLSIAALTLATGVSAALDPIVIKGQKFFFKTNGTQFFMRGIAYQQGVSTNGSVTLDYTDPLADPTTCARDIPELQKLNTNVIRTYALDPTLDHSECMSMLDAAGIYLVSDLSEPSLSINRIDPAWDVSLYNRYTSVIDAFANYTNVIGFFAGNEVTNNVSNTQASAFVKAAVRDMKAYIAEKNYRTMGIGYAADDDQYVRTNVADYFNCGSEAESIDFWGYNIYSWCGDSSYETSGYADRVAEFANYSAPVFMAEYGCNTQGGGAAGRKFTDIPTIFSDPMDEVFSGAILFEYFQETNDYGLVSAVASNSVSTIADFTAYSTLINAVSPTGVNSASYTPTNTALQACPTIYSNWTVNPTGLPPTPNADLCECMYNSLSCTVKGAPSGEAVGALFAQVCGYNNGKACESIVTNTTLGTYGQYSMCNSTQKLAFVFNAYYAEEKGTQGSSACDFGGNATIVSNPSAASSCSAVISSASANPGSGSGGSSSAGASTSKKNAAGSLTVGATLGIGPACLATYITALLLSGAGMILL